MKPAHRLILLLSLAANLALGYVFLRRTAVVDGAVPATDSRTEASRPSAPTGVRSAALPLAVGETLWSRLADATDADYADRLKAEGLPLPILRALVRARISARFADRLKALLPPPGRDEYWRGNANQPDTALSPKARAARRQIQREISEAVSAALGADANAATPYELAVRERAYGNLPADKIEQVEALVRDYSELQTQVRDSAQGVTLPEDRALLRLLEQERRTELAALMTPGELLEYDLRNSPSAGAVRGQTQFFEPTEDEYRALVQLRLDFDRQFGASNLSAEEQERKRAAEIVLAQEVKGLLTPERFADYELTANTDFRNTVYALGQFNFDLPVAREVMALRRDVTARAAAIETNPVYSAEQRAAELAALHREASSKLTSQLGPKAYAAFERESAGNWLRKLQPRVPQQTTGRP